MLHGLAGFALGHGTAVQITLHRKAYMLHLIGTPAIDRTKRAEGISGMNEHPINRIGALESLCRGFKRVATSCSAPSLFVFMPIEPRRISFRGGPSTEVLSVRFTCSDLRQCESLPGGLSSGLHAGRFPVDAPYRPNTAFFCIQTLSGSQPAGICQLIPEQSKNRHALLKSARCRRISRVLRLPRSARSPCYSYIRTVVGYQHPLP